MHPHFLRIPLLILLTIGVNVTMAAAQSAQKSKSTPAAHATPHKLAIQVDESNAATMNLALNNAQNVIDYYKALNEPVDVQVVTFGPGLHMLRADTSPVAPRISEMSLANPNLHFMACQNTQEKMSKSENKEIKIISEAQSVPSGVVTLIELQAKGYAYIRP